MTISDTLTETNGSEEVYAGQLVLTEDLDIGTSKNEAVDSSKSDTHTFQLVANSAASDNNLVTGLSVVVNANGSYTVDGNFDALADGETATITFQYTATDDSGTANAVSDAKTVTLTVTGSNDQPVVQDVTIADTLTETNGSEEVYAGQLVETDLDNTDTHTFQLVANSAASDNNLVTGLSVVVNAKWFIHC